MNTVEFYNSNKSFKEYVDRYATNREITAEVALTHKIVQEVMKCRK